MFEERFSDIIFYISEIIKAKGTVSLYRLPLSTAVYFVEDNVDTENPFLNDDFLLTPLTNSIIHKDGHHIFDLGYYSEITTLDNPARVCFHDSTQEPGISLNFTDYPTLQQFLKYLSKNMTFRSSSLPGFYSIVRLYPEVSNDMKFEETKRKIIEDAMRKPLDQNAILDAQNTILQQITPLQLFPTATISEVESALKDRAALQALFKQKLIPKEVQAEAWMVLTYIGHIGKVHSRVLELYERVKKQWSSITKSQLRRSAFLRDRTSLLKQGIEESSVQIKEALRTDDSLEIVYDVLMTLGHVYGFAFKHRSLMISLIRVPMHILGGTYQNGLLSKSEFSAAVFWSLIFMFEKCELRRLILDEETSPAHVTGPLADLCFFLHPHLFRLLREKGISSFAQVGGVLISFCSTSLSLPEAADVWLAAAASGDPLLYLQCALLAGIFFFFPRLSNLEDGSRPDLLPIVSEIFKSIGHVYLLKSGLILHELIPDLVHKNFPQL